MISIAKQELPEEAVKELLNRLSDDRWVMGEAVREFEERFAEYVGADYAVAMCNGTMALLAAYEALGVRGRGLVTTPYTFVATAAAATFLGSSVDFVDVLPEDACIDPARAIERARGAVVCAVHIFGYPARVDAIVEGTDAPVVEDCAQVAGAGEDLDEVADLGHEAGVGLFVGLAAAKGLDGALEDDVVEVCGGQEAPHPERGDQGEEGDGGGDDGEAGPRGGGEEAGWGRQDGGGGEDGGGGDQQERGEDGPGGAAPGPPGAVGLG